MSETAKLAARAQRVLTWIEGGCSSWGTPSGEIKALAEAALRPDEAAGQGEADELDIAHQRALCAGRNQHDHDGCSCSDETLLKRARATPRPAPVAPDIVERRVREYIDVEVACGMTDTIITLTFLREIADALAALSSELAEAKRQLHAWEQIGKRETRKADEFRDRAEGSGDRIARAEALERHTRLTEAEDALDALSSELAEAKRESDAVCDSYAKENGQLHARAEAAEVGVARLTHALETATTFSAEIKGALEARIKELTAEVARLKDGLQKIEAGLDRLGGRVNNPPRAVEMVHDLTAEARSLTAAKGG